MNTNYVEMKYPEFQKKLPLIVPAWGRLQLQRKILIATTAVIVILIAAFLYSIYYSALSVRSIHFNHMKKEMADGNA
jgi:cell division protein FtsL